MIRGTRRERYNREPSSRALTPEESFVRDEGPVVDRDKRLAGGQRVRSDCGLPQSHHGQQGYDADEDGGGFQDPRADEAHCDPLVLPLDDRVQDDGGADASQGNDHLQDGDDKNGNVGAGA
jgi:hypothetical protein